MRLLKNNPKSWTLWLTLIGLIAFLGSARADQVVVTPPAKEPAGKGAPSKAVAKANGKTKAKSSALTVAILDFDAKDPANPDLGKQIGQILTTVLSGEPGFRMIERVTVSRIGHQQELNLTGVVSAEEAVKIGKLIGAKIIVMGRAFTVGANPFIIAKIVGTDTSVVKAVFVQGKADTDMEVLVLKLAVKLGERLRESGPQLAARDDAVDPLPALKKKLSTQKLPRLALIIFERHETQFRGQPIAPAVEPEIKRMLIKCGFQIQVLRPNDRADWVRAIGQGHIGSWPKSLADVDVVITVNALSQFGSRVGNFVVCDARAEVNLISRKNGRITHADHITTRNADLSKNIAAKKALEKAGRQLGIQILGQFAQTLPESPAKDKVH